MLSSTKSKQLPLLLEPILLVAVLNLAKGPREDPKAGGKGGVLSLGGNPGEIPHEITLLVWLVKMDVGSLDVVWVSCPRASVLMAKIMPHLVLLVCT